MKNLVALAGATSVLALGISGQTAAAQSSGAPDGFVESKRGAGQVTIVRDGRTITAKANTLLYAGDRIRVSGNSASATVRFTGRKGRVKIDRGNSPLTVPDTEKPGWFARFGQMLSNVGNALGITDRRTSGHAFARSVVVPTGQTLTAQPLSKLDHFQNPSLFAAKELSTLSIRWCGDASDVALTYRGNLFTTVSRVETGFGALDVTDYTIIEGDQEYVADTITIEPLAQDTLPISYSLGWIPLSSVPRPASLEGKTELDAADKLEWGSWLLADEQGHFGNSYNLIAFSLLSEVKDDIWLAAYEMERFSFCPEYVPEPPAGESDGDAPADQSGEELSDAAT